MSSACAEWRTQSPTGALVPAQTPSESGMPPISIRGWKERIEAHLDEHHMYRSTGQIKALAYRIAKRAARMQYVNPDDLIRYVLDYRDETGEEAVRRVLASA